MYNVVQCTALITGNTTDIHIKLTSIECVQQLVKGSGTCSISDDTRMYRRLG